MKDFVFICRSLKTGLWVPALFWLAIAGCVPTSALPTQTPGPVIPPSVTATQFVFPPTYTPTLPGTPTETATPGPSRTPFPTSTLGPTLAALPTPLVEVLTASDADQPAASSRLLFLDEFGPQVWDPETGEILAVGVGILPESAALISLSRGGAYIAASTIGASGPVIVVYNRFTEEIIRTIQADGESIFDLSISPSGLLLAYISSSQAAVPEPTNTPVPSGTPTPEGGATPTATASPSPTATPPGSPLDRKIFLVDLLEAALPVYLADCKLHCTGITWSPGSDFFVWGQADGLWSAAPGSAADLVLEPFISGISGGAQTTDSYLPMSISPSGRYVLVRKGIRTGTILSVVDRQTGLDENLPGTGAYTGDAAGLAWLSGDSIFIARPGIAALDLLPAGEVWGLAPGSGESMFVKLAEFPFPGGADTRPSAPVELEDGRIGISLVNVRDGNDAAVNGLYVLDPATGELERVNYLPLILVDELVWLPDLSGALVLSESRLLFVPAGFGPVYSMRLLLGTDSCCFRWIP